MRKRSFALVTVALMGFASPGCRALSYPDRVHLKAWLTQSGLDLKATPACSAPGDPARPP